MQHIEGMLTSRILSYWLTTGAPDQTLYQITAETFFDSDRRPPRCIPRLPGYHHSAEIRR